MAAVDRSGYHYTLTHTTNNIYGTVIGVKTVSDIAIVPTPTAATTGSGSAG